MKNSYVVLLILAIFVLFFSNFVYADLGPKPTTTIDVFYNGNKITDASFSAQMGECIYNIYDDEKCFWQPAQLAWGGDCWNSRCQFTYMLPDKFSLKINIPSLDKSFITNEVSRTNFNSRYRAELYSNGSAEISETNFLNQGSMDSFFYSLIITLAVELFVAFIFAEINGFKNSSLKRFLGSIFIANMVSFPVVWATSLYLGIILLEIFAIVFEAYFVYYLNKKLLTLKKSFLLSILMNVISLIAGGFILFIIDLI